MPRKALTKKRQSPKRRVSKRQGPKRRVSKRRVSKRRVSKRRMSKNNKKTRSVRKVMKGGGSLTSQPVLNSLASQSVLTPLTRQPVTLKHHPSYPTWSVGMAALIGTKIMKMKNDGKEF